MSEDRITRTDEQKWRDQGFYFTVGVLRALWGIMIVGIIVYLGLNFFGINTDDCDKSAWHRCGMEVLTDNKTGVQYLYTNGALIVRQKRQSP